MNESMANGSVSSLSQYGQSLSCSNTGPTDVSKLNSLPLIISPVYGDAISCVVTNTAKAPSLSLQQALGGSGRIAANDQFNLSGTGAGSPAAVTTTGSGSAIDSLPYSFTATAGVSYALNEAMASGSGSNLSQYVASVSCSNAGQTDVSGIKTMPITVTPVAGDAINCLVTNTPKIAQGLTGRVFVDNGTGGGIAHNGIVDGGEVGLAGVVVRAMSGSTVLASTTTDGAGNFSLTLTPGAPVDIVVTPASGYLAISENVGNTGATNPSVTDSKISFTPASGVSYSGITFGEVQGPTFAPDQSRTTTPGNVVFLPHDFVARTSGAVTFSVTGATATPNLPGWSTTLFRDANCNGTFESGEPLVSAAIAVNEGSQVCLLLRVTAPAGAPTGAQFQAQVNALMQYTNSTHQSVRDGCGDHCRRLIGDATQECQCNPGRARRRTDVYPDIQQPVIPAGIGPDH